MYGLRVRLATSAGGDSADQAIKPYGSRHSDYSTYTVIDQLTDRQYELLQES